MNYLLLVLALLLATPLVRAQRADSAATNEVGLRKLDADYGFRGYTFEAPLSTLAGVEAGNPPGDAFRMYRHPTESKKIGRYRVADIQYTYYRDGRLTSIGIFTKGKKNTRGVLQTLQARYGKGIEINADIYKWQGTKVMMTFRQDVSARSATVFLYSLPMRSFQEAEDARAAQRAASHGYSR